jgi:superfamily II DNA/RNA helicase
MIGQSQSGTGKTAAFVLTMLSRLNLGLKVPQVSEYFFYLASFTNIHCKIGYLSRSFT